MFSVKVHIYCVVLLFKVIALSRAICYSSVDHTVGTVSNNFCCCYHSIRVLTLP